jgi:predicted nucleic acid-binding protein
MKFAVRHMVKLAFSGCAAVIVSAASPALANSANAANSSAASADMLEPLREVQGEVVENGDQRFKSLFSSWTALERTSPVLGTSEEVVAFSSPIPERGVSVPSRMPLEGASLTSGFGMRTHPVLGGRRQHAGIDLAAPSGTPVYATGGGVIGETFTLLGRRAGFPYAAKVAASIIDSRSISIRWADAAVAGAALVLFSKFSDQQISWVDCESFVLMRESRITRAFTFDRHFEDAGFHRWAG